MIFKEIELGGFFCFQADWNKIAEKELPIYQMGEVYFRQVAPYTSEAPVTKTPFEDMEVLLVRADFKVVKYKG